MELLWFRRFNGRLDGCEAKDEIGIFFEVRFITFWWRCRRELHIDTNFSSLFIHKALEMFFRALITVHLDDVRSFRWRFSSGAREVVKRIEISGLETRSNSIVSLYGSAQDVLQQCSSDKTSSIDMEMPTESVARWLLTPEAAQNRRQRRKTPNKSSKPFVEWGRAGRLGHELQLGFAVGLHKFEILLLNSRTFDVDVDWDVVCCLYFLLGFAAYGSVSSHVLWIQINRVALFWLVVASSFLKRSLHVLLIASFASTVSIAFLALNSTLTARTLSQVKFLSPERNRIAVISGSSWERFNGVNGQKGFNRILHLVFRALKVQT